MFFSLTLRAGGWCVFVFPRRACKKKEKKKQLCCDWRPAESSRASRVTVVDIQPRAVPHAARTHRRSTQRSRISTHQDKACPGSLHSNHAALVNSNHQKATLASFVSSLIRTGKCKHMPDATLGLIPGHYFRPNFPLKLLCGGAATEYRIKTNLVFAVPPTLDNAFM